MLPSRVFLCAVERCPHEYHTGTVSRCPPPLGNTSPGAAKLRQPQPGAASRRLSDADRPLHSPFIEFLGFYITNPTDITRCILRFPSKLLSVSLLSGDQPISDCFNRHHFRSFVIRVLEHPRYLPQEQIFITLLIL